VGNPEYQLTAGVWIRGILSDDYKVPVTSITYFSGGEEQPGRTEKLAISLPPEIRVESVAADKTLSQMLHDGEIDAVYSPRMPSTFAQGSGNGANASSKITKRWKKSITKGPGFFRSCTPW